ncbi:NACHT domain-containing NTPase [Pseudomonas sp. T8]|uniref:NACHT domain-containing protein n=1 Tax=Pseudomonas sp. T8 TaxID=645292 RepID=UPI0021473BD4|nr:hypothetical protein [Pseudomonas sp. T8]UUT23950.1 hypothetical protein NRG23_08235 [Pseudomonas sp. T8]
MNPYYLPRKLTADDRTYTEEELLLASDYVVVLSEPGGGKSSLLESLAQRLGVACVTANVFSHLGVDVKNTSLVIDAFDELAKIDQTGIHRLLAHAKKSDPNHVVISSRSSEWGTSSTQAFADFLGQSPLVVRLCEFDEDEQKTIFDQHVPGEHFRTFKNEVSRFDLDSLLPNPQFLKLFADAFVESGRHFANKRSIFSLAVERLSREANPKIANKPNSLSIAEKVSFGSEVFAKLLLCGSDGVTKSEANESRIYPFMGSLSKRNENYADILATRLFKPGNFPDQHRPVHKVVAEYCAASYLANRIGETQDSLSLTKCLPIIAPNSIVRDELRGLIGWMAALGNRDIQVAAIQLDPYAVLANGDPSLLESSSKRLLIRKLKEIESIDPYFRRGDFGRSFSVAGFFTKDIIDEVRPILKSDSEGHLRDLILELLISSKEAEQLEGELVNLLLTPSESEGTRFLVSRCLLAIDGRDHKFDLMALISEASRASLRVAAEIIKSALPQQYDRSIILDFFRVCAGLYPKGYDRYQRTVESRYFLKQLIKCLDRGTVEWLLDDLCLDLVCTCGKEVYECGCKTGTSKIIGSLLDRYFAVVAPPYDPARVWKWVENLNYTYQISASQSKAVEVLQGDIKLRQGIIANALGALTDREKILNTKLHKFEFHSHSGLVLYREDTKFLADLAFESDNPILWSTCIPPHQKQQGANPRGTDDLRRYLRSQALAKPAFMGEWVNAKRSASKFDKLYGMPFNLRRKINRSRHKRKIVREKNAQYIRENRGLIESGSHWQSLVRLANLSLMQSNEIEEEFGDELIAKNALRNCIDFISLYVPDLSEVAVLSCASKGSVAVRILFAACLEIMREKHSLEGIDLRLLKSLRANINVYYSSVSEEESSELKSEVDRLIFAEEGSAEDFIRTYIESQFAISECNTPDVWLLQGDEVFSGLRSNLAIEWLARFDNLNLDTISVLFDIAAQCGNRDALKAIIEDRCTALMPLCSEGKSCQSLKQRRLFWFVCGFYFISDISKPQWDWLQADADNIFAFYERSGQFKHNDSQWPSLTAVKVKTILDAFVSHWPEVKLPSQWGSDSPREEKAYRFIRELVWSLILLEADETIPVVSDLLADSRYKEMHRDLSSIYSTQLRKQALRNYEAPTPRDIVCLLDTDFVVTVEGMRQLIIDELQLFQSVIDGGEFNSGSRFYEKKQRLGELRCTEIIAERLSTRLESRGIIITPEHQLKGGNRSDFTATKLISGKRKLLVTEVKGQWHSELYTAAQGQLHERYSIHQDAEQQGIYLVLWFGKNELIAGRKNQGITSAQEMKLSIEANLPQQLKGLLDVFVLDLSRSGSLPSA